MGTAKTDGKCAASNCLHGCCAKAKNITKERLVEELKKYMTSNFGYQSLKVSWIQYIKDYDIFLKTKVL